MASRQFSADGLYVDVQFGNPVLVTIVGDVSHSSAATLQEVLSAVAALPGDPDIEVNVVLARFLDYRIETLYEAAGRATKDGQRLTITSLAVPSARP